MAKSSNIADRNPMGKWTASMKAGRKLILVVHGVIPASGEKSPFSLKMADVQSTNPSILVLELSPDVALASVSFETEVYYSEIIDRYDQYESVLLVKRDGTDLAFFDIEKVR